MRDAPEGALFRMIHTLNRLDADTPSGFVEPEDRRHFPRIHTTGGPPQLWQRRLWWPWRWQCTCGQRSDVTRSTPKSAHLDWRMHAATSPGTYYLDGLILLHGDPPRT